MKIMYRVESARTRRGAYRTDAIDLANLYNATSYTHPSPNDDAGLVEWWEANYDGERYEYLFGFETMQHYKNWFMHDDGRECMSVNGHVLGVYEVDDDYWQRGQFQMIAHKDHMNRICDRNLHTLEVIDGST